MLEVFKAKKFRMHEDASVSLSKRVEDPRFLTGTSNYVDDIEPENVAYLGIVRSPYAHALIKRIDFSKAEKNPCFIAALTGSDLVGKVDPLFETPGQRLTNRYQLAVGKARYYGEPVAAFISKEKYAVEDIMEEFDIEYEELPVVSSIEDSKKNSTLVYEEWGDNVALRSEAKRGDAKGSIAKAAHAIKTTVVIKRQAGIPIEPRSLIVSYDKISDIYEVYGSVQSVHKIRSYLAKELRVPAAKIHFKVRDVGGGFGTKGAQSYPEFLLSALFARDSGLTIKWTSTRTEDLLETASDRDQSCEIELGCDENGRLLALLANVTGNVGVMGTFNIMMPHTIMLLPGAYKIPNVHITGTCYVTNKAPAGPVRGAGRPDAIFFIENAMDAMARKLNLDPLEFRRRNVILPHDFPYDNGAGCIYDSGNFPLLLDTLSKVTSYSELVGDRKGTQSIPGTRDKSLRGIGVSMLVEDTGAQLTESEKIIATQDGKLTVISGSSPHGQGHETTLAQVCSEELGIPNDRISVVWGDTDSVSSGIGTFASRSAATAGSALIDACRELRSKIIDKASELLKMKKEDLDFKHGKVIETVSRRELMSFEELMKRAGTIEASSNFSLIGLPFGSGAHLCQLLVDQETGVIEIERLVIVDDCGNVVNATIVDGQIHGGVAHGIGGAIYEELAYGPEGQVLNSSLIDYTIPTAMEVPSMEVYHIHTPSPFTLNGAKGVGESGTLGIYPAIFNALNDALAKVGAELHTAPATPEAVFSALRDAKSK